MRKEQNQDLDNRKKLIGISYGFGTYSDRCLIDIFEKSTLFSVTPLGYYSYIIKPIKSEENEDHIEISDFESGAQGLYTGEAQKRTLSKRAIDTQVRSFVSNWIPSQWNKV